MLYFVAREDDGGPGTIWIATPPSDHECAVRISRAVVYRTRFQRVVTGHMIINIGGARLVFATDVRDTILATGDKLLAHFLHEAEMVVGVMPPYDATRDGIEHRNPWR